MELQSRLEEIRKRGLGVAGISYDPVETLARFSKAQGIAFPLLADAGSATIKRYGILATVADEVYGPNGNDPDVQADLKKYVTINAMNERHRGIPYPGTFMVDAQGRVTSRFFEEFYRERSTVSSMLLKIGAGSAPVQATRVSGGNLSISTYSTDTIVALGNRFSLVVDVTPRAGIHVYAPGASGYKVIDLAIAPQRFIRVLPIRFPASETYFFKPLNERVPVYQKPFRLVQEIVPEVTPEAQTALAEQKSLTLNGTLLYQACDDKVCFNPASVPLSWTMNLRPFVRE